MQRVARTWRPPIGDLLAGAPAVIDRAFTKIFPHDEVSGVRGLRPGQKLAKLGRALRRHDVVTLASIVEREAVRPEERPVIAAVYYNRLRKGMRLESDPTVQYALGHHTSRVLYRDLEIDSPYNTYRRAGLPPGPIGSPGLPSLAAAVRPARVPYLFFVAEPDGHHEFRATFVEHVRAVREARLRARAESAATLGTR